MPISKQWNVKSKSPLILLILQITILVICIGYVRHIYSDNIKPDKQALNTFKRTSCFLISKKLSTGGYIFKRYRADFLISYNVNNVQYNRWVSGNGLDQSFTNSGAQKKDILVQYDGGKTYPCWYNPEKPESVYLVPRNDWMVVLPLLLPLSLTIVTLFYFIKTLFAAVNGRILRPRKRRERQ